MPGIIFFINHKCQALEVEIQGCKHAKFGLDAIIAIIVKCRAMLGTCEC